MESAAASSHPRARRAVGIIRVSRVNGREGESFASPAEQRDRIEAACERDGLVLVDVHDELDVSGGTPLDKRAGLRRAVEAIENGEAEVIVAAYFDRLMRSLRVQGELVERVEAAGGQVLAVDVGQVTNGSAGQWLSGTMLGAVSEYQRRTVAERSAEAQARAVARGVPPYSKITPGYRRGEDGCLVPDPKTAPAVAQAFAMRAEQTPIRAIRAFLAENGIERSHHGVDTLLASRVVLGELHFGDLVNLHAHEPIVDRALWQRVQRAKAKRGRQAKSDRLLARLDILRCATCGARMVVGTSQSRWNIYRCPPTGDCDRRAAISAEKVEGIVADAVRDALGDAEGRASAESSAREAEKAVEKAQADLDAAIRAFAGLEDETAVRERLGELRDARDAARDRLDQLGGRPASVTVSASADWDRLSLDARRALIRATVERVTVAPGRSSDRVTVELVGQ
jgi:DNA invertase Pin-like site-specific DNA recombinase